jgi:uncharacterized membrane protein YuzA (DUF378 family)
MVYFGYFEIKFHDLLLLLIIGAFNAPVIGVFVLACVFPFTNAFGAVAGLTAGFGKI